jgi:NAD+-dependent protein deacetylase sirtuin 5
MALNARPNRAHYALAELGRVKGAGCVTLSQNVDGLSRRAGHETKQLKLLHGNLFDLKCELEDCGYRRENDFRDPVVPALAIPEDKEAGGENKPLQAAIAKKAGLLKGLDISDPDIDLPSVPTKDLPHCPTCKTGLLRPGVVWFGESLPKDVLADIDAYFGERDPETGQRKKIDLCLVIGTSSQVYPAAGYAYAARAQGARVAVVNMDRGDARDLQEGDWFFEGDAAEIVPEILKGVIGEVGVPDE